MAMGAGSPAIDAGDVATCAALDQRGTSRSQGGGVCDLGAFEYVPAATATHTATAISPLTSVLQPNAAAGLDTFILSAATTTNYGTATIMGVGEDNSTTNRIARSLIKFDLSAIPANAAIHSATLSLWTSSDLSNNTRTLQVYRLKVPFNETQATWMISATGVNWQQAGASGANDREGTPMGSVSIASNEPLNQEKQIALNPVKIQEWVSGSFANHGMIIVANTELDDLFSYKTSDSTSSAQRPKLVLQYSVPSGTPTHTPVWTASPTPFVNTATFTPTLTLTRTPTATPPASSFPVNSVLDGFNRANGAIGSNWSGFNTTAFTISANQLSVTSVVESYVYWNAASQGADQEVYCTFVQVYPNNSQQSLLLKLHNDGSGAIRIAYNAGTDVVQVLTYHPTQGWVQRGADIPVVFVNGDQFGARARADGTVEVYRNGILLGSRSITAWPYYATGGYVGLGASNVSGTIIDNFGGGTR
jgi:hypothetical protein